MNSKKREHLDADAQMLGGLTVYKPKLPISSFSQSHRSGELKGYQQSTPGHLFSPSRWYHHSLNSNNQGENGEVSWAKLEAAEIEETGGSYRSINSHQKGHWLPWIWIITNISFGVNNRSNQIYLIYMYRTFCPKAAEYTFSSSTRGTFSRTEHMLGHKTNLKKKLRTLKSYQAYFMTTMEWN